MPSARPKAPSEAGGDKPKRGRKRTTAPEGVHHPLQKFLGTFARLERLRQRRSAPEVAQAMGLSPGYLKMLEAGAVGLNPAMADLFIEQMAARPDEPVRDQRTIHFDRLGRYLMGSHWLAARLGSLKGKPKEVVLKAMEELKDHDPEFERLNDLVIQFVELKGDEAEREFLEKLAAPEVDAFLRSATYGLPESDPQSEDRLVSALQARLHLAQNAKWSKQQFRQEVMSLIEGYMRTEMARKDGVIQLEEKLLEWRSFLDMPSLNVDMLLDFWKNIAYRPFLHTGEIAAKWERENSPRFRSVIGIFQPEAKIVSEGNIKDFQYGFLDNEKFESVRFIFLSKDHQLDSKILHHDFVCYVNSARGDGRKLTYEQEKKIQFMTPISIEPDVINEFIGPKPPFNKPLDAYWSLEVESGLKIGFEGDSYQEKEDQGRGMVHHNVLNLSLRESLQRHKSFEQLWHSLYHE